MKFIFILIDPLEGKMQKDMNNQYYRLIKGSPKGDGLSRGSPDANHAIELNSEENYTCYSICYINKQLTQGWVVQNKTINLNVQGYTTTVKYKTFHVQAILLLKVRK